MTTVDDMDLSPDLNPADQELARLLAVGLSYTDAAEALGVSRATVYRRMRDPAVRSAVDRARHIGVGEIVGTLTRGAERAALLLAEVVEDETRPDSLRVRAAEALLSNAMRWEARAPSAHARGAMEAALAELAALVLPSDGQTTSRLT